MQRCLQSRARAEIIPKVTRVGQTGKIKVALNSDLGQENSKNFMGVL